MSNKSRLRPFARYELLHTVRTHRGADDPAYQSVYQVEDEDGIKGVRLSKSIMDVSGVALRQNITTLGPLVLSLDEQAKFLINFFRRCVVWPRELVPSACLWVVAAYVVPCGSGGFAECAGGCVARARQPASAL